MSMTPQEIERIKRLEELVMSLVRVENIDFIKNAERRLKFDFPAHSLGSHTDVDTTGATSGQPLEFDGTQWSPGTDNV